MPVPTRADFLLDPDLVFLNHGSFGAVPRVVQAEYERLQREMERNPVEWLGRRSEGAMREVRHRVAALVGADGDDLVMFPNPTTAINMVVRSLGLRPGERIVMTNLEYGAMDRTWDRLADDCGVEIVRAEVALPVESAADVIETVWDCVDERTRVLFLSHLTSSTALILPVDELCRRARERGILTIIDGAHVPGHLPLDLSTLGADIYTGALHKWVCAPKGCSFLWARREVQDVLRPLVTSWGWHSDHPGDSTFIDHHEWQGTRDLSPFLGVVAALDFMEAHEWSTVQAEAHSAAVAARDAVDALTGLAPICPPTPEWLGQMSVARLPDGVDEGRLKAALYDEYRIEVPMHRWNGQPLVRMSFHAHTGREAIDALLDALPVLLGRFA
jgi:isopenicillin-N epimerase